MLVPVESQVSVRVSRGFTFIGLFNKKRSVSMHMRVTTDPDVFR